MALCKFSWVRQLKNGSRQRLPCGRCMLCRLEYRRQWAVRGTHEASLYDYNSYITLTYDDRSLPGKVFIGYDTAGRRQYLGTLVKEDVQLFMKRLRKWISDRKLVTDDGDLVRVRYLLSGEYGEANGRPHYHACLFGFDFPDKVKYGEREGYPVYKSEILESIWKKGICEVGSVTYDSVAYVAGYLTKKYLGKPEDVEAFYRLCDVETGEVVNALPEFGLMSRKPGIGKPWLDKYMCEVYPEDSVYVRGKFMKPPRYYDNQLSPEMLERVRAERRKDYDVSENVGRRLAARVAVAEAAVNLKS